MATSEEKTLSAEQDQIITPGSRFIQSLVPAILLIIAVFALIMFIESRLESGWGLFLAITAGGAFGFGVLLIYWNAVDWVNIRIIRDYAKKPVNTFTDGELVAFSGHVNVDGSPMTSPFTNLKCAAYTYSISETRHASTVERNAGRSSKRRILAQGFHMLPITIKGPENAMLLGALPSVEDDLRTTENGKFTEVVRQILDQLIGTAPHGDERERGEALLAVQQAAEGEIHTDFCQLKELGNRKVFTIIEEVVPADVDVCVVGTYDKARNAIAAGTPRFGPDVMLYKGNPEEVITRIGKDIRWFMKFMIGMMIYSLMVILTALFSG